MDFLSYFALAILIFVVLVLAYGMIAIHDIPYHMAKARNHPQRDAIHAGGWISLFTLHAIWPFLWIWATAYHPVHGYRGTPREKTDQADPEGSKATSRIAALEKKIAALEANASKSSGPRSE
ncbi:MAG TPA: DUF3302 domain-containing protein [Candidatus Udaeobacter sp.]|jgi:hypothetical protein|nr:DUF3302 domain-containing protein [Candidatus Udaeobacter sp.]